MCHVIKVISVYILIFFKFESETIIFYTSFFIFLNQIAFSHDYFHLLFLKSHLLDETYVFVIFIKMGQKQLNR